MLQKYMRVAQYHETDQMGTIHHANYVKWMEEAKIEYMSRNGFGYDKMHEKGIWSPVVDLDCKYLAPTYFGDTVEINAGIKEFDGVTVTINYHMVNCTTGKTVFTGNTKHCFVNKEGKLIIVEKVYPELAAMLTEYSKEKYQ